MTIHKYRNIFSAIVLYLLIFGSLFPSVLAADEILKTVNADEFFLELNARSEADRGIILDVRTPDEFNRGHAPGSLNIDFYDSGFSDTLDGLDRDEDYFIYCNSGNRSGKALRLMKRMGFKTVYDLAGGWSRNAERLLSLEEAAE